MHVIEGLTEKKVIKTESFNIHETLSHYSTREHSEQRDGAASRNDYERKMI